ncbi:uncharacterized protein LAESUDRAFT_816167 [Laetiporus sulphureus 93-53]|uniref:F-box domain-containing protein n=1 Tax=Laetiporus sulphureus 93-53 TaxID=1314785 RepID=A0A165BG35_9APHY|nr:uncharacterized protein LAESUDRAFT_816167 [Laetiporus sulphureus 93-53]KZT00984.1 hypothetical protein LAESUDRAFT_816167 [Laetiporus sulphureus 93-53]
MSLAYLHDDVLAELFTYLSARDACRLSLTSKQIHPIAMQRAWSVVIIRRCARIQGVCEAMLKKPASRIAYLRELRVDSDALWGADKNVYSQLVKVIQHPLALKLRVLQLGNVAQLLVDFPSLVFVLASLSELIHLELERAGQNALSMIQRLSARPRTLRIDFSGDQNNAIVPPSLLSIDSFWPSLLHLSILSLNEPIKTFARAFPNIRRLQVTSAYSFSSPLGQSPCWTSLEFLDAGTANTSLVRAVKCLVRHSMLDIVRCTDHGSSMISVVRGTNPVVLSLSLGMQRTPGIWGQLVDVGQRLRYLILVIKPDPLFTTQEFIEALGTWKPDVSTILGTSQIVCIRVRVTFVVDPVRDAFRDLPEHLLDAIPTLRYVAMDMPEHNFPTQEWYDDSYDGHESCGSWWRVEAIDSKRSLVPVPIEVGEAVDGYLKSARFESSLDFVDPFLPS